MFMVPIRVLSEGFLLFTLIRCVSNVYDWVGRGKGTGVL